MSYVDGSYLTSVDGYSILMVQSITMTTKGELSRLSRWTARHIIISRHYGAYLLFICNASGQNFEKNILVPLGRYLFIHIASVSHHRSKRRVLTQAEIAKTGVRAALLILQISSKPISFDRYLLCYLYRFYTNNTTHNKKHNFATLIYLSYICEYIPTQYGR